MRHLTLRIMCMSLLLVAVVAEVNAAPKYEVGQLLTATQSLVNKKVTTSGVVADSRVLQHVPGSQYRGEFVLQAFGDDPVSIRVRTKKAPPPISTEFPRLTGIFTIDKDGVPLLIKTDQLPWLYVALGVLVVLAVVLVVMIVKPTSVSEPNDVPCPQCGHLNELSAVRCEECSAFMDGREVEPIDVPVPVNPVESVQPLSPIPPPPPPGTSISGAGGVISNDTRTRVIPATNEARPIADLVIVEAPGGQTGHRIGLRGVHQKIGRDPAKAEILLPDDTVSREHALIWQEAGVFYLQDQASTAGTLVNGNRITRQALNDGDEIMLGSTKVVFRVVPTSGSQAIAG